MFNEEEIMNDSCKSGLLRKLGYTKESGSCIDEVWLNIVDRKSYKKIFRPTYNVANVEDLSPTRSWKIVLKGSAGEQKDSEV